MQYVDPLKKRAEIVAVSYSVSLDSADPKIVFTSRDPGMAVTLSGRGESVVVDIASEKQTFAVCKVQLTDRLNWVILDLDSNAILSRLAVSVPGLDFSAIDLAIKKIIGDRSHFYFRRAIPS